MDRDLLCQTFRDRVADLYKSREGSKSPMEVLAVSLYQTLPLGLSIRCNRSREWEIRAVKRIVVLERSIGQVLHLVSTNWAKTDQLRCLRFSIQEECNFRFLKFEEESTFDPTKASDAELLQVVIKIDELLAGLYAKARATEEFMQDLSTGSHDALLKVLQS